jgi:hypothetical protein
MSDQRQLLAGGLGRTAFQQFIELGRSPDRSTLRTAFRDTFRSREISLIVLPFDEVLAPNPANRLPPTACFESKQAAHQT